MEVSNFGRNVKALRERERITQIELADRLDITQTTVSNWETGGKQPRSKELVERMCEMFGINRQDLFGFNDGLYAKLHGLVMDAQPSSALVPLLGTTHMGEFSDEDECDRTVEVPANVVKAHPDGFCVHADGECMNNRYPSDSVLFVDPHMQPFDGCAVLAETDQYQSIVRKYNMGSTSLMLSPDSHSDSFEDIIIRAEDAPVKLKGVVVWYQAEKDLR